MRVLEAAIMVSLLGVLVCLVVLALPDTERPRCSPPSTYHPQQNSSSYHKGCYY